MLRFIDLFCGIGGFRAALAKLGHHCVFSSDFDEDARSIYEENYGERPAGDITSIPTSEVPIHDVLCGGFPCQPFSISGNQAGFEDARGTLLQEILRIARDRQPKVLFLENVKNYRTHESGRTLSKPSTLESANYQVHFGSERLQVRDCPKKREFISYAFVRIWIFRIFFFLFPQMNQFL